MKTKPHTIRILPALLCTFIAVPSLASTFRQHGAHVHGFVTYDIAQDGAGLLIEIYATGMDVVGFEHTANTEQEKSAMSRANQLLNDSHSIVNINAEAQCSITDSAVSLVKSSFEQPAAQDIHNPFVEHSAHASFDIKYQFNCQNPQQLNDINTSWFQHFPATNTIAVNYFTDKTQNATELNKQQTHIHLDN
ncbi:DUF2796 domain-containing protein [Vibrio neonatus]|uniref:DUF2796 domain-containing protein n=1 Tax=Vibrio neonatus TaxID=278860 RepID=UPI0021C3FF5E|nr:DUF2796 domain-containing protein [Vibrio neonatus]